jgi:hypothetical protein
MEGRTMRRGDAQLDVWLSGLRHEKLHLVAIRGQRLWLPTKVFGALCQLAAAQHDGSSAYVSLDKMVVSRLRKAIDRATNHPGAGTELIETGVGHEYRLLAPRQRIAIDRSFAQLPAPRLIRAADQAALVEICQVAADPSA